MVPRSLSSASRPAPTHFLSIALVTAHSRGQLESNIAGFKRRLKASHSRLPGAAVRPVGSFHLTLNVIHLPTPRHVQRTTDVLRKLDFGEALVSGPRPNGPSDPLFVDLKSLSAMRNPRNTSVLYLTPEDPSGRLKSLAQCAFYSLSTAGLCRPTRPLRLHATVYNTRYIAPRHPGRDGRSPQVDARALVKEYKDYVWAEGVTLERLGICEMRAEKVKDEAGRAVDEVYREIASIRLP